MAATFTPNVNLPAQTIRNAADIPYVTRAESQAMAEVSLNRFLDLVQSLSPDDWNKPTACTAWTVRDMLAHQAGAYASFASFAEFRHQYSALPKRGQLPEDATNEIQLADRLGRSPAELIAELKQAGPRAIANRAKLPLPVRLMAIPHPISGWLSFSHLADVIFTRDTWMHRLDISRATGREMLLTPDHDGRVVALVMRDLAQQLPGKLNGRSVIIELTGIAGGQWRVGKSETPEATLRADTLDFNIYASGRFTFDEIRPRVTISGDTTLAEQALRATKILY